MLHSSYPGSKFPNGWEINEIIDSGGMGTVYIVGHPQHEESLVAKIFKQQFFSRSLFSLFHLFLFLLNLFLILGLANHQSIIRR
jgi:hypothetical protein